MRVYTLVWQSYEESLTLLFKGPDKTPEEWNELVRSIMIGSARSSVDEDTTEGWGDFVSGRDCVLHAERFLAPYGFEIVHPTPAIVWSPTIVDRNDGLTGVDRSGQHVLLPEATAVLADHNEKISESLRKRY